MKLSCVGERDAVPCFAMGFSLRVAHVLVLLGLRFDRGTGPCFASYLANMNDNIYAAVSLGGSGAVGLARLSALYLIGAFELLGTPFIQISGIYNV